MGYLLSKVTVKYKKEITNMVKKSVEERIQRLEDIQEIQNLMSRYEYYHSAFMQQEQVATMYFASVQESLL